MSLESAIDRLAAAIEKSNERNDVSHVATVVAPVAPPAAVEAPVVAPKAAKPKAAPKAAEPKAEEAAPVLSEIQQRAISLVARPDLGRAVLVEILTPYSVKKISELADNAAALRAIDAAIKAKLAQEPLEV